MQLQQNCTCKTKHNFSVHNWYGHLRWTNTAPRKW